MPHKILVAIDRSGRGRTVLNEALTIAKATAAHVRVLHIIPIGQETMQGSLGHLAHFNSFLSDQRELPIPEDYPLKEYLSEAIDSGMQIECFQYSGEPGQIICNFALIWEADLIVMGQQGQSCFSRMLLGSVSDYVVHHTPCSVHIVHCPDPDECRAVQAHCMNTVL